MSCCGGRDGDKALERKRILKVINDRERRRINSDSKLKAKIVLLGDTAVGKTSLVLRYVKDDFLPCPRVTFGGAYSKKYVDLQSGETIKLHIWDTGGSEEAQSMVSLYYRKAKAGLITFDLCNSDSFHDSWIEQFKAALEPGTYQLFLVGNKCDLAKREVSEEEALEMAERHGMRYFETSSKTGEGVEEMFEAVAEAVSILADPAEE